jgi:hypothetical protein
MKGLNHRRRLGAVELAPLSWRSLFYKPQEHPERQRMCRETNSAA